MKLTIEQKRKIEKVGRKYNLKLILLHGSFATGKTKFNSDLDIAVLGKSLIEFDKLLQIHGDLADIFGDNRQRELDLKSLHQTDPLFCYQVVKDSQLLYGNITDYNEFRAYAFSNFFDSQDLFRLEKHLIYKFQNYLNKRYA